MIAARPLLALVTLLMASCAARAESCDDLVDKVTAATKAEVGERTSDFARFSAGPETTLSLSCGGSYPSSVGAQFRGESPPDAYYALFGQAGQAVTGIAAGTLTEAARRARADAQTKRHANVPAGGALVTCSFSRPEIGPLTMCAVIEQADRS